MEASLGVEVRDYILSVLSPRKIFIFEKVTIENMTLANWKIPGNHEILDRIPFEGPVTGESANITSFRSIFVTFLQITNHELHGVGVMPSYLAHRSHNLFAKFSGKSIFFRPIEKKISRDLVEFLSKSLTVCFKRIC